MKIVQINTFSNGSTGKIASAIHNMLLENGCDAYFFYGIGNSKLKNTFKMNNMFDIHLHALLSKFLGLQGYFSHIPTFFLIRKLKKISPDIIHLHNVHGSYINLPMLYKYIIKNKIKVVSTLHDCIPFTGKCPYYTAVDCNRWKTGCGNCQQLYRYPASKWFDFTHKILLDKQNWYKSIENMKVISVSKWLESEAKQSILNIHPLSTIFNGIDTYLFSPKKCDKVIRKYNLKNKFVILGLASEWSVNKGVAYFIELSKYLNEDEIIVLVGKKRDCVNTPSNILFIDRTDDQEELAEIYSYAGVTVSFSKEETFGLTPVESMACGTPIMVFNSTALPELVYDNCGYCIEIGDVKKAREIINLIRQNGKEFYSCNCRKIALERYSSKIMLEKYFELYKSFF